MTDNSMLPQLHFDIQKLPPSGEKLTIVASPKELEAMAQATDVESVDELSADLKISRWQKNGAQFRGKLSAKITQLCVVTLDPMTVNIEEPVDRKFLSPSSKTRKFTDEIIDGEIVIDPEADDLPDFVEDGKIDVWSILAEELNLAIDPFPRSDEAESVTDEPLTENQEIEADEDTHRPFSDLKSLITEKKIKN